MLILKESLSLKQVAAVLGAFAGSLLIIKPTGFDIQSPAAAGLLGGMGAGIAYTCADSGKAGGGGPFIMLFLRLFHADKLLPVFILNYPNDGLAARQPADGGRGGDRRAVRHNGGLATRAGPGYLPGLRLLQIVFFRHPGIFSFCSASCRMCTAGWDTGVICAMAVWMFFYGRNGGARPT